MLLAHKQCDGSWADLHDQKECQREDAHDERGGVHCPQVAEDVVENHLDALVPRHVAHEVAHLREA